MTAKALKALEDMVETVLGFEVLVVVTGGRSYAPSEAELSALGAWLRCDSSTVMMHGGCLTGVDAIADRLAMALLVPQVIVPANWNKYGRRAGPLRNNAMATIASKHPRAFLAAFPGGNGTKSAVSAFRRRGVPVLYPQDMRGGGSVT